MHAATRLLAIAPILVGLGWAGWTAADVIRADDLAREASIEMSTWSAASTSPALETWTSVHDKLQAAIRIRPNDPASHELLGMLGAVRRESPQHLDEGVRHMVRALELRPVSPYTWAHLAELRYGRGEPGANLELALTRAAQLGPSEPGVQVLVADYGLAVWPEISPTTQAEVERMIAAGMRRNPLEMLRISDRRGRLEAACHYVSWSTTPAPRVGRYCERWEITP